MRASFTALAGWHTSLLSKTNRPERSGLELEGMTKITKSPEYISPYHERKFLELIPQFARVWPSMKPHFMNRLRGELQGSLISDIRDCVERIHNAYTASLDEADTIIEHRENDRITIEVSEQGFPRAVGRGGWAGLEVEVVSNSEIRVKVTAYVNRSVEFTARLPKNAWEEAGVICWLIDFDGHSSESSMHVRNILQKAHVAFEEE